MIEMLITNGFTGVKNSPVSNLAWTLLKKSRDTLFCILFRFYPEQLCRLENFTRLPLLIRKNNAKPMIRYK